MQARKALFFAAAALYVTASAAQPLPFRETYRYEGHCLAWSQSAKAESSGPCVIDIEAGRAAAAAETSRLVVHHNGTRTRVVMFPDGLGTINGRPARMEQEGETLRALFDGNGLEFPAPQR